MAPPQWQPALQTRAPRPNTSSDKDRRHLRGVSRGLIIIIISSSSEHNNRQRRNRGLGRDFTRAQRLAGTLLLLVCCHCWLAGATVWKSQKSITTEANTRWRLHHSIDHLADQRQVAAAEPARHLFKRSTPGGEPEKPQNSSEQQRAQQTTGPPSSGAGDTAVHEREFVSPQAKVQMECQRDKTLIRFNFTNPFNGVLGVGRFESHSGAAARCTLLGNGAKVYELRVDHNATECNPQWDPASSSITNTLFVRFHSTLETGNDIAKNIMCRLKVGDLIVGRRPLKRKPQPRKKSVAS